jgi:hypothetical protein
VTVQAAVWKAIPRGDAPIKRGRGRPSRYIEPIRAALKRDDQVIEIECAGQHCRSVYRAVKTAAQRMDAGDRISVWSVDGKVYVAQRVK